MHTLVSKNNKILKALKIDDSEIYIINNRLVEFVSDELYEYKIIYKGLDDRLIIAMSEKYCDCIAIYRGKDWSYMYTLNAREYKDTDTTKSIGGIGIGYAYGNEDFVYFEYGDGEESIGVVANKNDIREFSNYGRDLPKVDIIARDDDACCCDLIKMKDLLLLNSGYIFNTKYMSYVNGPDRGSYAWVPNMVNKKYNLLKSFKYSFNVNEEDYLSWDDNNYTMSLSSDHSSSVDFESYDDEE